MLLGVLWTTGLQGHLVTCSRHDLGLSDRALRCLSDRRQPQAFTYGFILPRASRLLQSAATHDLPCVPQKALRPSGSRRAPPLGFPSLIATSAGSIHIHPESTPELRSVLDVSHVLDGLRRHQPCGSISPRCHVQGLPYRGLSLSRSRTGFPRPRHALLPLSASACGLTRASSRALGFRALLPARVRCRRKPVKALADPRPSWASPPPGAPSPQRRNHFGSPPSTTLAAMNPPPPVLDVSPLRSTVCLGSGHRPARGF